jgi:C-terminal processing protease CtpA/Prc
MKSEDYPLISEIQKGSVAYRSGMLEAGDRLMYIDNHSLRGKAISDIEQMLKNCDELVKLKIKKDDVYTGKQTVQFCRS